MGPTKGTWNLGFFKGMTCKDRRSPKECPKNRNDENFHRWNPVDKLDMQINQKSNIDKRGGQQKHRRVHKGGHQVSNEAEELMKPESREAEHGVQGIGFSCG